MWVRLPPQGPFFLIGLSMITNETKNKVILFAEAAGLRDFNPESVNWKAQTYFEEIVNVEVEELYLAIKEGDDPEILKETSDVIFTLVQLLVIKNLDSKIKDAFRLVTDDNLSKFVSLEEATKDKKYMVETNNLDDTDIEIVMVSEEDDLYMLKSNNCVIGGKHYPKGKVIKPTSYTKLNLTDLVNPPE